MRKLIFYTILIVGVALALIVQNINDTDESIRKINHTKDSLISATYKHGSI